MNPRKRLNKQGSVYISPKNMFSKLTSQKYQIFRLQIHLSWQTGVPDALGSIPSIRQLGVVAYARKPSTWKVRAGRTEVRLHESLSQRRKY